MFRYLLLIFPIHVKINIICNHQLFTPHHQLFEMQMKYNDARFKLDERFADEDDEEDDDATTNKKQKYNNSDGEFFKILYY